MVGFKYISDDYNVGKVLGAGQFGETSVLIDKRSGNTLVVKRIPKVKTSKKMFNNEVSILQRLKDVCDAHLLCYVGYEDDEKKDNYYIITEYLGPYTTMEKYITETPDEERWKDAPIVLTNLLLGLKDMHQSGVAHRDIKPSNLMINKINKNVKYIDFGLSCMAAGCDDPKDISGSPLYMPPEINFSNSVQTAPINLSSYEKFDVWSLAITMLEFILGDAAFSSFIAKSRPEGAVYYLPDEFTSENPQMVEILEDMLKYSPQARSTPKTFYQR